MKLSRLLSPAPTPGRSAASRLDKKGTVNSFGPSLCLASRAARATLIATGRDDTLDLFVRCSWRFAGAWSVQPYAVFVYNRSNIELYTFRKADGGVMLHYDFR